MTKEDLIQQQVAILKRIMRLTKRKPCKTIKGIITRYFIIIGLFIQLRDLELQKRGIPPLHNFAKGGIVGSIKNEEIVINKSYK